MADVLAVALILATCLLVWRRSRYWTAGRPHDEIVLPAGHAFRPGDVITTTMYGVEQRQVVQRRDGRARLVVRGVWPRSWRLVAALSPLTLLLLTPLRP